MRVAAVMIGWMTFTPSRIYRTDHDCLNDLILVLNQALPSLGSRTVMFDIANMKLRKKDPQFSWPKRTLFSDVGDVFRLYEGGQHRRLNTILSERALTNGAVDP